MELISNLAIGVQALAGWEPLLAVVAGIILGIAVGVLPGLSASTGVALLLPFTWFLDPAIALILLGSIYTAAEYGGAITAIAINTPGEPSSMVTALDGYPMTKQGRMHEALSIALVTSVIGGLIGTVVLILFAPSLAEVALTFGPAEYVALGVLGLTLAASLSTGDYIKGAITTVLGLLLTTVGQDPITGSLRFTFGSTELIEGIDLIPAIIGLFAASEVFAEIGVKDSEGNKAKVKQEKKRMRLADYWALRRTTLVGSFFGVLIGIFPGAGTTISSLVSYAEARRYSKKPEDFGKGSPEGVAASESANNACVGGALVPMLTLGIPGSGTTAVMLSALIMHGLQPGPELFVQNQALVYGLFASLILANIVMLGIGAAGINLWLAVMRLPKSALMAMIISLCIVGAYGVNNSMTDVYQMLAFGVVGFLLKRYGYPVATVVLGLVLGFMIETNLRRTVLLGGWESFVNQPIALVLLLIAFASVFFVVLKEFRSKRNTSITA
ncbi:tripartite tricarboxylate transporter permease [Pseudochelatococcus sp. B33]